jgi:subtilisin family serine protease
MTALGFPEAWNISTGNEDVIIAVFGNGIHSNHPALINSISSIPGYNFYGNNTNVTETRSGINYNHETSVAGILAAQQVTYNNYIVKGLAPGCKIMSVKFYEPDDE